MRQKRPFLTTAGGYVFGMAGLAADLPKWLANSAVSGVAGAQQRRDRRSALPSAGRGSVAR